MASKKTRPAAKLTSVEIERLAGKGMKDGASLTAAQAQRLSASVMRHIQEQKKLAKS